jgi:hypothetical protein
MTLPEPAVSDTIAFAITGGMEIADVLPAVADAGASRIASTSTSRAMSARRVVKTLKCGTQTMWDLHTRRFLCTLPRGTYKFSVYAVGLAGNEQSKIGRNTLTVQ